MKIVISGALGYIGGVLTSLLSSQPQHSLMLIDKLPIEVACKYNPVLQSSLKAFTFKDRSTTFKHNHCIISDLDQLDLPNIFNDVDCIIHLAANPGVQLSIKTPSIDFHQNIVQTFNILEAIRSTPSITKPRLIFSSSAAPLSGSDHLPYSENSPTIPISPYGASKSSCEAYLHAYRYAYGINSSILRFSNVYGPGSLVKTSVVSNMIRTALTSNCITVYSDGQQVRDFIYVDDIALFINWLINSREPVNLVHLSTNQPTSINKLAQYVQSSVQLLTGSTPKIFHTEALPCDARVNYASDSYLKSLKAVEFRPISLSTILSSTQYFIENLDKLS